MHGRCALQQGKLNVEAMIFWWDSIGSLEAIPFSFDSRLRAYGEHHRHLTWYLSHCRSIVYEGRYNIWVLVKRLHMY